MKTKHTPGPWSINDLMAKDKRRVVFWYYIIDRNRNDIVEVKGRHCGIKNSIAEANVKLIVVAPEMFDVLSDALETMNILLNEMPKEEVVLRHEITGRKLQIESIIQKATS